MSTDLESEVRHDVALALERAGGFNCLVTENVEEMLAEVEAGRVHLAILDVSLSGTEWQGRHGRLASPD